MTEKRNEGLRKFNRTILNPVTKLIAGRFFYSLVAHVGRRSGKEFSTPVVAANTGDCIFIPLPYGANTDWFLNVRARGECVVKIKGKWYSSTHPEIVEPSIALFAFSPTLQRAFERSDINQFLRLSIK
jgi:deazaflavin-dependent oxidoreductase (nitroreductase family)